MSHEDTNSSLGTILSKARQSRGLPLEQVAHETRIRVQRLKEIEADDLTQFSHPSYARMYLTDYARYLGVDLTEIRPYLPDWGECGTEGYQYLQETPTDSVKAIRRLRARPRLRTLAAVALSVVLVSIGGFKIFKTMRDIDRLNLSRVAQEDRSALSGLEIGVEETHPTVEGTEPVTAPADVEAPDLSQVSLSPEQTIDSLFLQMDIPGEPTVTDFASDEKAVLFVGGSNEQAGNIQ